MEKLCIGIDLGTTNSVLASVNVRPNGNIISKVVDISRAVDVYNTVSQEAKLSTAKRPTLPSFVFYRQEKNYEPLVGDFAKLQYSLRPHLVAKSIKSQMGRPFAEGLSPDVPDKTPAQISARILQHMLGEASKVYRRKITEAVITVPANFDSSMCKATRDAAEMAGITVRNPDGSERPILLSEPNAVIYDLINQIHNGEISDIILDLSSMKRVLVFDLGGGTLDITMHEIKRRDENLDILKVDEIATNRYTRLGGDDFDEAIAMEMFNRYQRQYAKTPNVVSLLKQKENIVMAQLRTYAENVKLDLSMQCAEDNSYVSGWDDEEGEVTITTGGSMGGIGYAYDDTFTKEELEKILSPFMAYNLKFSDYKNLENVKDTRNIIYPILDVLKKASEKLQVSDVKIDAVILNGGMSKFYMISDRLKEFFGLDPIVALDPDQSVAKGAAVYHYLLTQHSEMQDDMRLVNSEKVDENKPVNIEWGKIILNDALYIGAKNDAVHMIIPTGAALPYKSEVMTGFKIEALQKRIEIPIKSQNLDGSYRTIANGNIEFSNVSSEPLYVAFTIYMAESKVISMNAWTSYDLEGRDIIEHGVTEIAIDTLERPVSSSNTGTRPAGIRLDASGEIRKFKQLCQSFSEARPGPKKSNLGQKIRECGDRIKAASNRSDFARPILYELTNSRLNDEAKMRLFTLARRISGDWSESEIRELARTCMAQLNTDISGFRGYSAGTKVNANIQAIYTLSICASNDDMKRIIPLHDNSSYTTACLYAHAKTRTEIGWIQKCFSIDAAKAKKRSPNHLQVSAHAIAVALKNDSDCPVSIDERKKTLSELIDSIKSGNIRSDALTVCVVAVGTICDCRNNPSPFSQEKINEAEKCIEAIPRIYPLEAAARTERNCSVALKLIRGENLNADEEKYLMTKLEFDI